QEERELLARLGEILGSSDSASQIEAVSGLQAELKKIDDIHRENLIKKGRLYRAAGLLFGIMAGILIL
ncbi:MAG: stage III sporulation protein AB, partial [Ruminococcus sp.]|nr:stage III sporulation protein AB [Ruminococcus sp.]